MRFERTIVILCCFIFVTIYSVISDCFHCFKCSNITQDEDCKNVTQCAVNEVNIVLERERERKWEMQKERMWAINFSTQETLLTAYQNVTFYRTLTRQETNGELKSPAIRASNLSLLSKRHRSSHFILQSHLILQVGKRVPEIGL